MEAAIANTAAAALVLAATPAAAGPALVPVHGPARTARDLVLVPAPIEATAAVAGTTAGLTIAVAEDGIIAVPTINRGSTTVSRIKIAADSAAEVDIAITIEITEVAAEEEDITIIIGTGVAARVIEVDFSTGEVLEITGIEDMIEDPEIEVRTEEVTVMMMIERIAEIAKWMIEDSIVIMKMIMETAVMITKKLKESGVTRGRLAKKSNRIRLMI